MNLLDQIARELTNAESVVVLTGAGISTESGLPDYRGTDGLWKNKRLQELAHIETFKSNPVEFWQFYAQRLAGLRDVRPNTAHLALEEMYKAGLIKGVVTQNVDGLHRRDVYGDDLAELHGTLRTGVCSQCETTYEIWEVEDKIAAAEDGVPRCEYNVCLIAHPHPPIRPAVVLFGEPLPISEQRRSKQLLREADYILCLGSSLAVTPAARLPETVLVNGGRIGVINLGPTSYDDRPGVTKVEAPLGEAMTAIAEALSLPTHEHDWECESFCTPDAHERMFPDDPPYVGYAEHYCACGATHVEGRKPKDWDRRLV